MSRKQGLALCLTVAIAWGIPVGTSLLMSFVESKAASVVCALVGFMFGTFALDIYRALLGSVAFSPRDSSWILKSRDARRRGAAKLRSSR